PQNIVTPAVTLQRIANVPQNHLRGFGNLDANRVQVDCFADTYLQARALSAACRTAINAAGHTCELELDEYDEQVLVYRVILDFNVWL
ncbi:Tail completion protein, partial [uncultured Caudovirales phage]